MHLEGVSAGSGYKALARRKGLFVLACLGLALAGALLSLSHGAARLPLEQVLGALTGLEQTGRARMIILNIRLPQTLAGVLAGAALAGAGAVMQSVLRNPLGSPFTLGISNAAAFGAAFSVMVLGAGVMTSGAAAPVTLASPAVTVACALAASLLATLFIIAVSRLRRAGPETMVLAGIGLSALFTAGSMFLQYLANDVQLAVMVFWSFGDLARASWRHVAGMALLVVPVLAWFGLKRFSLNALDAGEDTAASLGVRVGRERLAGLFLCSLMTAVVVSFLGIIGFVGIVCPHLARFFVGDDHRYLFPASCLLGAALLTFGDVAARQVLSPHALPVSVLTAFLGAPAFLGLLLRRRSA